MAWLSMGSSNDDLCDKLVAHGILKEGKVLDSFRITDRGDFFPEEDRNQAYLDRPFKKGPVHISAPHMYTTVLDALELKPGNAFLNVGSGSGYLCCLAWNILGKMGVIHGIEISDKMVEYSRENIKKFATKNNYVMGKFDAEPISIICGNCFDIDVFSSSSSCKYDRIYVGAGCPENRKQFFYDLLADGGVLVLPIDERNQMMKVKKIAGTIFSNAHISNVHFAPLIGAEIDGNATNNNSHSDLTFLESNVVEHDVSSLFFHTSSSSLSSRRSRASKLRLPALVWQPSRSRHFQFPEDFRAVVKLILVASNQCDYSKPLRTIHKCLCSILPTPIWFHILSYASRDWFVVKRTDTEILKLELLAERRMRKLLEDKLEQAEQARRSAERERDLFRNVMMRLGSRTPANAIHHSIDIDDEEDESDDEEEENEEEEGDPESDDEEEVEEQSEEEIPLDIYLTNQVDVDNDNNLLQMGIVEDDRNDAAFALHEDSDSFAFAPHSAVHPITTDDQGRVDLLSSSFGSNTTQESDISSADMDVVISPQEDRASLGSDSSKDFSLSDSESDEGETREPFHSDD